MLALLLLVLMLLVAAAECRSHHKCQHLGKENAFPPPVPHRHLNRSFIDAFDEVLVIGDVHGCYQELRMLLHQANATGSNVLKILAGDLTRKGPDSAAVIRLARTDPSVAAVRGNNDQKVLAKHYKAAHFNYTLSPDDLFIGDLTRKDLDFLRNLPYTISIPSLNAVVVHAGVRPGFPLQDHDPYDLMNIRNLVPDPVCRGGFRPVRSISKGVPWASEWSGPEHVYFGHDHKRGLQTYPLATGVDTGCVAGGALTGVFVKGPRKGRLVRQRALEEYVHVPNLGEAVEILEEAPENVLDRLRQDFGNEI